MENFTWETKHLYGEDNDALEEFISNHLDKKKFRIFYKGKNYIEIQHIFRKDTYAVSAKTFGFKHSVEFKPLVIF